MILRLCAAVIALTAVVLLILQIAQAFTRGGSVDWPAMIFPPLITIALALVLAGIGDAIAYSDEVPADLSRVIGRMQQQQADLQKRIEDIAVATDRMSRTRTPPPPPPAHITAEIPPAAFNPILQAIAEVRELALLTDSERRERLTQMTQDRKRMLVRQLIEHMEKHEWAQGMLVLNALDQDHPGDVEVRRTRTHFEDARHNAEPGTVNRVREQVDNYVAIGAWEQALQAAEKLCADFPGNGDAERVFSRITRERDIHVESSVARMVEEIRHDIDRRLWRRALMHAQRLIDRFPDHEKTRKIVEQLDTLQTNAEIEERQELEVRIQELIRGAQFQEAIELSEELLVRFPNSPQAEAIDSLLPRIRQLAAEPQEEAAP